MTGDESLLYKVFKAKYFPNSNSFLEAQPKQSASWAWQSVMASNKVLETNWKWRVGNGEEIKIWSDPCMAFRPTVPKNPNSESN